jgi:hypothetical protein
VITVTPDSAAVCQRDDAMTDTLKLGDTAAGHPRRWLILYVILVAECMDLLDSTIVNVAVPAIREQLLASSSSLQWIVGGYPLAIAVGLIAGGRLGDLYGRRRMFVIGTAGFTVASLLCATAWSPGSLIAFRLAQGVFGAVMLPQGLGLLRAVFPPAEMSKAFSVFGPVLGSAAVLGPIIGGGLIAADLFDRRHAAMGAGVTRRPRRPPGLHRHGARQRRCRDARVPAHPGPGARLAGLGVRLDRAELRRRRRLRPAPARP